MELHIQPQASDKQRHKVRAINVRQVRDFVVTKQCLKASYKEDDDNNNDDDDDDDDDCDDGNNKLRRSRKMQLQTKPSLLSFKDRDLAVVASPLLRP